MVVDADVNHTGGAMDTMYDGLCKQMTRQDQAIQEIGAILSEVVATLKQVLEIATEPGDGELVAVLDRIEEQLARQTAVLTQAFGLMQTPKPTKRRP